MLRAMRCWLVLLALGACADPDVSRAVGARCDRSDECDDRCLAAASDYPGGFCSVSCDTSLDCATADTLCVEDEGGVCLFECRVDANCTFLGAGWQCVERDGRGGDPGRKVMVCRGA